MPVYRGRGCDRIRRTQGTVRITGDAPHAVAKGQGLASEYFATADCSGEPALRQVEPKFSQAYTLSVYAKGNVRLWLGGKLLLDASSKVGAFHKAFSEPVPLAAGRRYAIKAEWTGPADGECHHDAGDRAGPFRDSP